MAEPGNTEPQPLKKNPHGNESTIRKLMDPQGPGLSEKEARGQVAKSLANPVTRDIVREHRKLSLIDSLTSLPNKRWLLGESGELPRLFELASRHQRPFHVMMIDLDDFKAYNDTFGHLDGDVALKLVADRLRKNVRTSDFVARFGGEEFTILVPETDLEGASTLAEKIRMSISTAQDFKKQMTVSIGLASYPSPDQGDTAESMLNRADKALYDAKRGGKNQVALWHEDRVVDIRTP
jgi:two-component system cell cycle response regulator